MLQTKKAHIITTTICIILFFYVLLVYVNYSSNKYMLERLTQNNQMNMVQFYKQRLDEWLSFKKKIVSSTVESLEDLNPKNEEEEIKKILQNASSIGDFDSAYIGYENNLFLQNTDEEVPMNYVAPQREWYKIAMQEQNTTVTLPYQDAFVDKKVLSVVSAFYNKKAHLKAVLSADLNLNNIQHEILNINQTLQGFAFLITKDGNIIVSPKGSNLIPCDECTPAIATIMQNKNKSELQTYTFKDQKYIIFYEPLKNSDWIFAMTLNENKIFKELNQKFFQNLLFTIALSVLGILGFYGFIFMTKKTSSYKRLLNCFAHNTTQAVAIVDIDHTVLFLNYLFQKYIPLQIGQKIQTPLSSKFTTNDEVLLCNSLVKNLTNVMTLSKSIRSEKIYFATISKCLLLQYTPLIVESSKIEGCIITINDITHEYLLEKQNRTNEQIMLQHSKTAAMGEMIVAITHQWRQPLSAILILIGILKMNLQTSKTKKLFLTSKLEEIITIIQFMEQTLYSFKMFYKPQNEQQSVNLDAILGEVMLIMKPIAQINNIELSLHYEKNEDYSIVLYPNYLKQIIINLISNAKDAIFEKKIQEYNTYIQVTLMKKNDIYSITVEDNGCGIPKEFINKLFQEMQTTKGDRGTGNGLYLCKLLVENKLNGSINLISATNPTIFEIILHKAVANE